MEKDKNSKLGNFIRERRESLGLTVRELKEKAGLSTTSIISEIENASKKRIDPIVLKKIAKGLDINYIELYNIIDFIDKTDYMKLKNFDITVQNGFINTGSTGNIHITVKNGLSSSYNENEIIEQINNLPKDMQKEVFEFISFKYMMYSKNNRD